MSKTVADFLTSCRQSNQQARCKIFVGVVVYKVPVSKDSHSCSFRSVSAGFTSNPTGLVTASGWGRRMAIRRALPRECSASRQEPSISWNRVPLDGCSSAQQQPQTQPMLFMVPPVSETGMKTDKEDFGACSLAPPRLSCPLFKRSTCRQFKAMSGHASVPCLRTSCYPLVRPPGHHMKSILVVLSSHAFEPQAGASGRVTAGLCGGVGSCLPSMCCSAMSCIVNGSGGGGRSVTGGRGPPVAATGVGLKTAGDSAPLGMRMLGLQSAFNTQQKAAFSSSRGTKP